MLNAGVFPYVLHAHSLVELRPMHKSEMQDFLPAWLSCFRAVAMMRVKFADGVFALGSDPTYHRAHKETCASATRMLTLCVTQVISR
jgi:hypothetical protein